MHVNHLQRKEEEEDSWSIRHKGKVAPFSDTVTQQSINSNANCKRQIR